MDHTLIFATNNANKVKEINSVVPAHFRIVSLRESGIDIDIPEPFNTLEANAKEKTRVIFELTGSDCFSEDSGLEVTALNGRPGVRSARYAGDGADSDENMNKLLEELSGKTERAARFRTVICLSFKNQYYFFEGACEGQIAESKSGDQGFGYDPIFIPDGTNETFASMGLDKKNIYSHRKKAVMQLVEFLNKHHGQD
jgi:XTP/dITP diphosphohydrolase